MTSTIEQDIQAAGANVAPRITLQDIQDAIIEEHYFTGDAALDAGRFRWLIDDHRNPNERKAAQETAERIPGLGDGGARLAVDVAMGRDGMIWSPSLNLLTFCVLVLRNGFTVTGESACASPENFDAEIGRKVARANAVEKMWPLMGYALKEKLHASEQFKARTGREDRRGLAQTVVVMGEDFPLGKACDLSGDGTCESCQ